MDYAEFIIAGLAVLLSLLFSECWCTGHRCYSHRSAATAALCQCRHHLRHLRTVRPLLCRLPPGYSPDFYRLAAAPHSTAPPAGARWMLNHCLRHHLLGWHFADAAAAVAGAIVAKQPFTIGPSATGLASSAGDGDAASPWIAGSFAFGSAGFTAIERPPCGPIAPLGEPGSHSGPRSSPDFTATAELARSSFSDREH